MAVDPPGLCAATSGPGKNRSRSLALLVEKEPPKQAGRQAGTDAKRKVEGRKEGKGEILDDYYDGGGSGARWLRRTGPASCERRAKWDGNGRGGQPRRTESSRREERHKKSTQKGLGFFPRGSLGRRSFRGCVHEARRPELGRAKRWK